ncbi:MAG TPA: hypothetical protein VFQ12_05640 [Thermoleophilaceae bacterium]|nr:hypothetical protein [Thermoleophilaceae bacterium]
MSSRSVQLWCVAVFALALAAPVALWHHAMEQMAADFHLDAGYLLTGWTGYGLIALGLLLLLPVVASVGRHPDSRLYPRSRNAFLGWGTTLYLLGTMLASIVGSAVGT